jgi:CheY-like chemotaxis protein
MPSPTPVLIVDDDASHLKLYSLLVEGDGFLAVPLLVKGNSIQLPNTKFKVAVVDYKLGVLTAVDVAIEIRKIAQKVPILLLTDMMWMPDDFKPYAAAFVRKGEPDLLLSTLKSLTA